MVSCSVRNLSSYQEGLVRNISSYRERGKITGPAGNDLGESPSRGPGWVRSGAECVRPSPDVVALAGLRRDISWKRRHGRLGGRGYHGACCISETGACSSMKGSFMAQSSLKCSGVVLQRKFTGPLDLKRFTHEHQVA